MLVHSQRRDGSFLLAGELGGGEKFKKPSKSYVVILRLRPEGQARARWAKKG